MIFDHEFDPCPALWSHNFAGFAGIFQRTEAFGNTFADFQSEGKFCSRDRVVRLF